MTTIARMPVVIGAGQGPKIVMTEYEEHVARLPYLRHYFDPAKFQSTGLTRDRVTRAPFEVGAGQTKIDSDAAFNDLPVIQCTSASTSGLRLPPGTVTNSFTFIGVGQLDAARFNGGSVSHPVSAYNTGHTAADMRVVGKALSFRPDSTGGSGIDILSVGDSPSESEVALYICSFDFDSSEAAVGIDNGASFKVATLSGPFDYGQEGPPVGADFYWHFFGNAGGTGWIGKFAECILIGAALHRSGFKPILDDLCGTLRSRYGLS